MNSSENETWLSSTAHSVNEIVCWPKRSHSVDLEQPK